MDITAQPSKHQQNNMKIPFGRNRIQTQNNADHSKILHLNSEIGLNKKIFWKDDVQYYVMYFNIQDPSGSDGPYYQNWFSCTQVYICRAL